ncbi:ABC transporter permease [Paenibacillus filicis]|uniref:ABC transporter permease n=1 Tax=Paenibacillus filicis TaxID=669464 RepID=A0ABU9DF58_9BACL
MITVIRNNYARLLTRLPLALVMTALMLGMILLAIYVTGGQQVKGHLAWIDPSGAAPVSSAYLQVEVMSQQPPLSALVKHQYDAFVSRPDSGDFKVTTLKNDEYQAMLLELLRHPDQAPPAQTGDRGIGSNILGFLMMFLLMGSFMHVFTFADDKEKGLIARIAVSPVTLTGYLTAQFVYGLSMLLPVYLTLSVLKILGVNIGFTLGQYALLLGMIGIWGISLALFLYACFDKADHATMLGNSVLALTSILSGSFYSFSGNNPLLERIISVFPQRQLLEAAGQMEQHAYLSDWTPLLYMALVTILLIALSAAKLKSRYERAR